MPREYTTALSIQAIKMKQPTALLLLMTVIVFSVMYVPQPLAPILTMQLGVDAAAVGLLVSVTLIPLAIAPLTYGVILRRLPALEVLRWAMVSLALSCLALGFVQSYVPFLVLRGVQGLIMPAIFTALMAYLAAGHSPDSLKGVMARYVSATIVGGLTGRLISGVVSEVYDYHAVYWGLAVCLLIGALLPWGRAPSKPMNTVVPSWAGVKRAWSTDGNLWRFLAVSCLFFVFAGFLNFLPLRLASIDPSIGPAVIGLVYLGYLGGIATSLNARRIALRIGGANRTLKLSMLIMILSCASAIPLGVWGLFVMMWVFCLSMFLFHSLAVAEVNQAEGDLRGVVNGLYVTHYYGGGVLGTWLPGYVYDGFGWPATIMVLVLVGLGGLFCLSRLQGR